MYGTSVGLLARAAGAVHRDDVAHRHRQHAVGVGVPQVLLGGERQLGQVGERDVLSPVTPTAQPLALDATGPYEPVDQLAQPGLLQCGPFVSRHRLLGPGPVRLHHDRTIDRVHAEGEP